MAADGAAPDWKPLLGVPLPPYSAEALELVADRAEHLVLQAIRQDHLAFETGALPTRSLMRLFRCSDGKHAFDAPAHEWASFREPQMTGGLAHFLSSGRFDARVQRVRHFMTAALGCAGAEPFAERLSAAAIVATEAVAEEARVDLIVQATTADGDRFGVVVEAKFGHHLTRGQLPAARRHAATRGLDEHNAAFVVVLPNVGDVGTAVFCHHANRRWRAVSWWSLLTRLEESITPDADDDAFRAFRHTLWRQTYA